MPKNISERAPFAHPHFRPPETSVTGSQRLREFGCQAGRRQL